MSKNIRKVMSILATFVSGLGGTSSANQPKSSVENANAVKIAALSVAGKNILQNSETKIGVKEDSLKNEEHENDNVIDPDLLDKYQPDLPSPPHIGAIMSSNFDTTKKEEKNKIELVNLQTANSPEEQSNDRVQLKSDLLSSAPPVDIKISDEKNINLKSDSSAKWEKIYEEAKPDFSGAVSFGADEELISTFYNLQQDNLALKNKKRILKYSSDSSLFQKASFEFDTNVNKMVELVKKQKNKLLSGENRTVKNV